MIALENRRYKPLIDKMFYLIWVPISIVMLGLTVLSFFEPTSLFVMIPVDIFTFYFLFSQLFGYVELRESSVFIKFGFILKIEIPYSSIRGITTDRKFYSESMLSLKNALSHVNIKYNKFDLVTVSVKNNDGFIKELLSRIEQDCKQREMQSQETSQANN